MPAEKKPQSPFGVNQCSLCDEFRSTFGDQKHGGVRYCRECVAHTFGWSQIRRDGADARVLAAWGAFDALPAVVRLVEAARAVPAEFKKAHSIGEATRRLREQSARDPFV